MGEETEIRWTDHTHNIVWGCTRVSEACLHCYAETFARRLGMDIWGKNAERRTFGDAYWRKPLRWNRLAQESGTPKMVFCSSMADVFEDHPTVAQERGRLWDLIGHTPWLTWQLLTKRPENVSSMVPDAWYAPGAWPVNVWVGTTVESQRWADERLPILDKVPAPVRFASCEPLFGPLDLSDHLVYQGGLGVNWVIAGGESGAKARPSHPQWFRNLRDTCAALEVPFLFKQWGEYAPRPDLRWNHVTTIGGTPEDGVRTKPGMQRFRVVEPEWACGVTHAGNVVMERVGKRAAGWVLDGRTWDLIPGRRVA